MQLTKHHGYGNDFLVAFVDRVPADAAELARRWCHRTRGVGADGLVFGEPSPDADLTMTLFNADGSRAEISGNGIRCLAQAAFARRGGDELAIDTPGGRRQVRLVHESGHGCTVAVDMGPVGPGPGLPDAALLRRPGFDVVRTETAEVGNPHVVLQVDDVTKVVAHVDGPAIEEAWQPGGINVHFMQHLGPAHIELVHWERGVGVTEACGSGATVAATLAHRWGLVTDRVQVTMPGGTAEVVVGTTATLIGEAVHVADVDIADVEISDREGSVPANG